MLHTNLFVSEQYTQYTLSLEIEKKLMKKWSMKEEWWKSVLNALAELLKRDYGTHPLL